MVKDDNERLADAAIDDNPSLSGKISPKRQLWQWRKTGEAAKQPANQMKLLAATSNFYMAQRQGYVEKIFLIRRPPWFSSHVM